MSTNIKNLRTAANKKKVDSFLSKTFVGIFFASMILNLGQQMSNSLLSLYANSEGAPANRIGTLMSMFAITALVCRFFAGPAMDAFNRKLIVSAATVFLAMSYLGYGLSPKIAAATGLELITVLMIFRLIQGVGSAFSFSCYMTMVTDVLPKKSFAYGMGIYACTQVVAQAIGPTVGVFLKNIFGYNKTYLILACTTVLTILAVITLTLPKRERGKFLLTLGNMVAVEALIPTVIIFFAAMGFTSINSFLLVYAEKRGIENGSLFFTVYAVSMLATRPIVGRLTDKLGFVKVGVPALLLTAASLALIGISENLPMLLFAAFVNAFGFGAVQPALQSLAMKSVPQSKRGAASSTSYIGQDASTIVGPVMCGYVANIAGYSSLMWLIMTIPIGLGIVCTVVFRRRIEAIEKNF